MSGKGKEPKIKQKVKGKSKRKAKSPLLSDNGGTGQTGCELGGWVSDPNVNKRQHLCNVELSASPINTLNHINPMNNMNSINPNMNSVNPMAQQGVTSPITQVPPYPYSMHTPQQTPQHQMYLNMSPAQTPTPPWALEIMEDMKLLKQTIPKLDNIEKTVDKINMKIGEMEIKIKTIENRVTETENACSFINTQTEQQKTELDAAKSEIKTLEKKCKTLTQTTKTYEDSQKTLNTKLCELEARSMRENLIFYGIPEAQGENCELLVQNFIKEELQEESAEIIFDRVHRLGTNSAKKPRPIVAKFHEYKQRENIRQKGFSQRDALKAKKLGVGIQQPKEIRDRRKKLYPIMDQEEKKGNRVRLIGDKLYINGVLYQGDQGATSME